MTRTSPDTGPDERHWLVYDERGWNPGPAVVVRIVPPPHRYGFRIEGPFVPEAQDTDHA